MGNGSFVPVNNLILSVGGAVSSVCCVLLVGIAVLFGSELLLFAESICNVVTNPLPYLIVTSAVSL